MLIFLLKIKMKRKKKRSYGIVLGWRPIGMGYPLLPESVSRAGTYFFGLKVLVSD